MTAEAAHPQEIPGHRLWLERDLSPLAGEGAALFVGFNPSDGDAVFDDSSIRRMRWFAAVTLRRARLLLGNLYTHRSPDPRSFDCGDPAANCGEADEVLDWLSSQADIVVLCWGALDKARNLPAARERANEVMRILARHRRFAHALRLTKGGYPAHPLYIPRHVVPVRIALRPAEIR